MATAAKERKYSYRTYGNVAYEPAYRPQREREQQPEERPLIRTRERVRARPRVAVRPAGQVSLFAVVGFLAVGLFAVLLLMSYARLDVIGDEVVDLRGEISELKEENTKLQTEYEMAYDLKTIEESMTASGAMTQPQAGQTVVLDLSEPDSVEIFDSKPSTGAAATLAEVLRGVLEYFS